MASENGDLRLLEPSSDCFLSEPLPPDIFPDERPALMTEFQNFVEPVGQALQMSFCTSYGWESGENFEEVAEEEEVGIWKEVDDVMLSITMDPENSESFPGNILDLSPTDNASICKL